MREIMPEERLEIREFILDANLYLISNSFMMVSYIAGYFYMIICYCYYQGFIPLEIFISMTALFIGMLFFIAMGYKSISSQKRYISRLDEIFKQRA